jgi:hypothetical protein
LPVKRRSRSRPRDNGDMTVPIGTRGFFVGEILDGH